MVKEHKRIWKCSDCGWKIGLSYDEFAEVGDPFCSECESEEMELTEEVEEKVKIAVYIRGGVCDCVDVNLPSDSWIWVLVDYDDNPDLPDNYDPFKNPGK